MSVRVRLTRVGSKKNAVWRVVVADQRSPRDGRTIETLGHYNPQTQPSTVVLDRERLDHWIALGAQPTNSVRKLMRAPDTPPPAAAVVEEATADAAAAQADAPSDVAGATEPEPTATAEPASEVTAEAEAAPEPDPDAAPPSEGAGDAEAAPEPEVAADPDSPDAPDEPPSGDAESA
jgi:small subunit ribosomal protein S16